MIVFTLRHEPPSSFPAKTIPRIARACSLVKKSYANQTNQIGLEFVSESVIKKMNRLYRNKNSATDVLSFSSEEGEKMPKLPSTEARDLGDIFVCPAYAAKEAKRRRIGIDEELVRLVVHGTLHLMGYDHADERSEHRMFSIQEGIIEKAMKSV